MTDAPTRQEKLRQKDPKAAWAHKATASALKRGLRVRQPCEVCGDFKTDAHHPDYDRPLLVEWLCRKHHRLAHAKPKGS